MKLVSIGKAEIGKFLTPYEAVYINEEGQIKEYEMVSRNKNLTIGTFGKTGTEAIGIIAFNKERTKILLAKEFRLACNNWVYNFPGGLVEEGETLIAAAKRELKEETGLNITGLYDTMEPSYTSVGISDEQVYTVICKAEGEFEKSTSADEEIKAGWFTKEEIEQLFKENALMSQRTQSFLWIWCYYSMYFDRKD